MLVSTSMLLQQSDSDKLKKPSMAFELVILKKGPVCQVKGHIAAKIATKLIRPMGPRTTVAALLKKKETPSSELRCVANEWAESPKILVLGSTFKKNLNKGMV